MFKYILALSLVFIFATEAKAQAITQTWIDPCNGDVQTATFVVGMGAITIMYRGQAQAFTKQDFIDGTLMAWVMETTATIPCPVNPVVTATVDAAARAAAQAAAEAAARAAAQAAAEAAAAAAAEAAAQAAAEAAAAAAAEAAAAAAAEAAAAAAAEAAAAAAAEAAAAAAAEAAASAAAEEAAAAAAAEAAAAAAAAAAASDATTSTTTTGTTTTTTTSGTTSSGSTTTSTTTSTSTDASTGSTSTTTSSTSTDASTGNTTETTTTTSTDATTGETTTTSTTTETDSSTGETTTTETSSTTSEESSTTETSTEAETETAAETETETTEPEAEAEAEAETETETEETEAEAETEETEEETEETESSEEEDEETSEDEAPQNPLLIASDLTVGQNIDKSFSTILTMGISQSSMAGDVTYGATGMVWSNLNQFALAGSYTKMNYTPEGDLNDIDNYTLATAYMSGSYMAMFGYTWVKSHLKYGTYGYNLGFISMFTKNNDKFEKSFIGNFATFWTKPFVVSERLAISPQIFLTNNPVMYQHNINEFISNQDLSGMLGAAFDFAITRRFAFSTAYRVSGATVSEVPILHFFMIGSRLTL